MRQEGILDQKIVKIQRENLVQAVIREVERLIANGEFAAGERLPPQPVLAAQFGVGLSTVREAIQSLRLPGLVDVRPGRGTHVCQNPQAILLLCNKS